MGFPGGAVMENPSANAGDAGDTGSSPGSGRSPGERNGSPLKDACLGSPRDRGAWRATVRGSHSQTRLSGCAHAHAHARVLKILCAVPVCPPSSS